MQRARFVQAFRGFVETRCQSRMRTAPLLCGRAQTRCVALEVLFHFVAREWFGNGLRPLDLGARACCRFARLFGGIENRVDAIGETFQLASAGGAARTRPTLKGAIDSFQHRFERDARFLPGFDDGPIERRDEKMRAAFAPEIFFNFREIVEVVESFHEGQEAGQFLVRSPSGRRQALVRFWGVTLRFFSARRRRRCRDLARWADCVPR